MCALPTVTSTPFRLPLIAGSQSSYFSDFNQSVASPSSRRIHTVQKKAPLETETSISKEQAQARIEVSKVKFSLLLLALMSAGSILFAFLSIQILLSVHSSNVIGEKVLNNGNGKDNLKRIVWEAASSISLISITSSISAFFVSAIQLFFALKMLKNSPTAIKRVLIFLGDGRFLRCIVYSMWFFSILIFVAGSVLYSMLISAPLGTVSKGIGVAFGLASIVICAIGALHATYAWSLTYGKDSDEKYMTGNLSTLV
ncbi:hypothetical protein Tcan_04720 [Toxocara canis]|uniref:Transmembrane protein n=2 Tax=Toxocara canis TaxID=6265 RepID=A0A0B2V7R8_TOXCA|nr:hypothetical protein Tcan_04720 [Toxocara canis]VDM39481.1 unnamed protein product [Toxocara canis]